MVSYLQFGNLRLSHFLPNTELAALDDWEYENQLRQGIRVDEIKSIFDEPYNAVSFVKDRKSYEFRLFDELWGGCASFRETGCGSR